MWRRRRGPRCAPDDPTLVERCEDLQQQWDALLDTIDTSCDTAADCVVVDEHEGGSGACDGAGPTIGRCDGVALNETAASGASGELDALLAEWNTCNEEALCQQLECAADCATGQLACSNGHCILEPFDCLGADDQDAGPSSLAATARPSPRAWRRRAGAS